MRKQTKLPRSPRLIVGLMSGTSADGIDAVVAAISGSGRTLNARVAAHVHQPYPPAVRKQVLSACLHGTVSEICELNFALGALFGRAALAAIRRAGLRPEAITAIGSHGQTLHHLPNARTPSTFQIGEPAVIAEMTGITTVADFRVGDMAAGGQGAPLVPYADWALFTHPTRPRIIQNIGGIGNLTFLPPRAELDDVMAFDTGPGNMVIDALVAHLNGGRRTFDRDGRLAAHGKVCERLLSKMLSHPYLAKRPPKTTGREEFGEVFVRQVLGWAGWEVVTGSARHSVRADVGFIGGGHGPSRLTALRPAGRSARPTDRRLSPEDTIATATAFTAASIANAYERFVFPRLDAAQRPKMQVILGGGGAKNPTLRRMLAERLGGADLLTHEDFGLANAAKEALAFAILAHETLLGHPANVPAATGARRSVVLGKIVPGRL